MTAVTAHAKENVDFYTKVLGLRLVKKTVNQDDVSAYHLFYADAVGSPGTDMTFFDWKHAGARQESSDQISRTYFRVNDPEAIKYWDGRLKDNGIESVREVMLDGKSCLLFEDREGQRLGLVDDLGAEFEGKVWIGSDQSSAVPEQFAIKGFFAVELAVQDIESVDSMLVDVLGWEQAGEYDQPESGRKARKYAMDGGGPGREVHVTEDQSDSLRMSLAGTVHHVAFRVKDEAEMLEWIYRLEETGVPHSGEVERFYFKSLYFRITPGILFEIATDGPGFSADEDIERLGEKLALPPFLEPRRAEIEAGLDPIL